MSASHSSISHNYFRSSLRILFKAFLETKTQLWKKVRGAALAAVGAPCIRPLLSLRRKRKILILSTFGRSIPYLRKKVCSKKMRKVPRTFQKVSFIYSKESLWNKIFRQNLHKLGGSKHTSSFLRSIRS